MSAPIEKEISFLRRLRKLTVIRGQRLLESSDIHWATVIGECPSCKDYHRMSLDCRHLRYHSGCPKVMREPASIKFRCPVCGMTVVACANASHSGHYTVIAHRRMSGSLCFGPNGMNSLVRIVG